MRFVILLILLLAACSTSRNKTSKEFSKDVDNQVYYVGHYKTGGPYKIKGQTYRPLKADVINYSQIGLASWYKYGKITANGDRYDKNLLTAAHKTLPMPSMVKVTNLNNNKSIILMVNDRGPFYKNRIIDVSEKAASVLAFKKKGVAKVKVEYMDSETKSLLAKLNLPARHGARAKDKIKDGKCSVNCHIKLVNIKYNLAKDL